MGVKLGATAVAYRNSGTYGSPTWAPWAFINDWSVDPSWDEADAQSRATRLKMSVKTLLGLTFSGTILKPSAANTEYTAMLDALNADTVLDVMILDGPSTTNNSQGYRCDVQVTQGTEDQGTGVVQYKQITLKPTPSDNVPKSVLVTSGAPVFSTLPA